MARPPKNITAAMRFEACVKKTPTCWNWTGLTQKHSRKGNLSYGVLKVNGKRMQAHRFAYEQAKGVIPTGLVIRHDCDNPLCVNPAHLTACTQQQNVADCIAKGRNARGERAGAAKLTDEDVRHIRKVYKAYDRHRGGDALARRYGVSSAIINGIINRTRWAHVCQNQTEQSE